MSDLRAFAIAPLPAASPAASSAAAARIGWGTAPTAGSVNDASSTAPTTSQTRSSSSSRTQARTTHETDEDEEEDDEGRGLLQASIKPADNSAAQRRSKAAAASSAASSHRSSAAPADIALESSSSHHHHNHAAAINIAPSPLRRVQPTIPARPFNPLEHERNQRKRWYWFVGSAHEKHASGVARALGMILGVLELCLCMHLLLEDSWAGLDVFVLQLVVVLLSVLAAAGMALSGMAMWALAHLVDPIALMAIPDTTRGSVQGRRGEDTLLTDSPTLSPSSPSAASPAGQSYSSAALLSSLEASDESIAFADAQRMAEEAEIDENGNIQSKRSSASPNAQQQQQNQAVVVNVQPIPSQRGARATSPASASSSMMLSPRDRSLEAALDSNSGPGSIDGADNVLSSYFNLAFLVVILYFGFASSLLHLGERLSQYVHTHALERGLSPSSHRSRGLHLSSGESAVDFDADPEVVAETVRLQLAAYLTVMAILALFTTKLMMFTLVGVWGIQKTHSGRQQRQRLTPQSYLLSAFVVGVGGCVLVACGVYTAHHQTFVPLTHTEIVMMSAVGWNMVGAAIAAMVRFYLWSPSFPSACRLGHIGHLACVCFALMVLTFSLWLRGRDAPFYAHPESTPYPRSDLLWQLELAAQMKIGVLTVVACMLAACTCVSLYLSLQLDAILRSCTPRASQPTVISTQLPVAIPRGSINDLP